MRPDKTQNGKGKRPTIRDVASRAGVSHQTVSRVINSQGYVHKETRERVLNAIKDLDFVPNGVARSLTANRTQTIGVVTTDISEHFFGQFVAGAEAEGRRNGFYLIIGSVEEDAPADDDAWLQLMLERRVEGLIISRPMLRRDSQQIVAALAPRVPIVLVSSELKSPALDSVDADNERGGHDATEYLLERGHQAIPTIVGPSGWPSPQARLNGSRHAVRAHRIPFTQSLVRHAKVGASRAAKPRWTAFSGRAFSSPPFSRNPITWRWGPLPQSAGVGSGYRLTYRSWAMTTFQ